MPASQWFVIALGASHLQGKTTVDQRLQKQQYNKGEVKRGSKKTQDTCLNIDSCTVAKYMLSGGTDVLSVSATFLFREDIGMSWCTKMPCFSGI